MTGGSELHLTAGTYNINVTQLAQAQSVAAAGQAVGGIAGNYATNSYVPQNGNAFAGAGMTGQAGTTPYRLY